MPSRPNIVPWEGGVDQISSEDLCKYLGWEGNKKVKEQFFETEEQFWTCNSHGRIHVLKSHEVSRTHHMCRFHDRTALLTHWDTFAMPPYIMNTTWPISCSSALWAIMTTNHSVWTKVSLLPPSLTDCSSIQKWRILNHSDLCILLRPLLTSSYSACDRSDTSIQSR